MERYAVIMGGGSGKRLWPLSRLDKPKQFLNLLGEGSLIESTIRRLDGIFDQDHIIVIGTAEHKNALIECTKGLVLPENILIEPVGRNTAPCIAMATMFLAEKKDAIVCVLPSDHHVGDATTFREVLSRSMDAAEKSEHIVTVGITPTFDATGYGYIQLGEPVDGISGANHVVQFIEKPNKKRAGEFFYNGGYLWNGGIFVSKASVMLSNIKEFIPEVYQKVSETLEAVKEGNDELAAKTYSEIENIAIDYGVMEKCRDIIVFPGDFEWSDVGSFYAISKILKDDSGNAIIAGNLLAPQANNLTVYSTKKIVAASGVDNLVIIDMDDVLYICNVNDSEKTKQLVEDLAAKGHGELE